MLIQSTLIVVIYRWLQMIWKMINSHITFCMACDHIVQVLTGDSAILSNNSGI